MPKVPEPDYSEIFAEQFEESQELFAAYREIIKKLMPYLPKQEQFPDGFRQLNWDRLPEGHATWGEYWMAYFDNEQKRRRQWRVSHDSVQQQMRFWRKDVDSGHAALTSAGVPTGGTLAERIEWLAQKNNLSCK